MYQFLGELTDIDTKNITKQLYIEMLKVGYTRVAEFHYLHHDIDGCYKNNTANLATMAHTIFVVAKDSGIGLTLLPVLYQHSGFGEKNATEGQKRFINSIDQFNQLVSHYFVLSVIFSIPMLVLPRIHYVPSIKCHC